VTEVNPAYTSVIGRNKFSCRYGLSSHSAAALVIARRSLPVILGKPRPRWRMQRADALCYTVFVGTITKFFDWNPKFVQCPRAGEAGLPVK
jgi:hypothetical protein